MNVGQTGFRTPSIVGKGSRVLAAELAVRDVLSSIIGSFPCRPMYPFGITGFEVNLQLFVNNVMCFTNCVSQKAMKKADAAVYDQMRMMLRPPLQKEQ